MINTAAKPIKTGVSVEFFDTIEFSNNSSKSHGQLWDTSALVYEIFEEYTVVYIDDCCLITESDNKNYALLT